MKLFKLILTYDGSSVTHVRMAACKNRELSVNDHFDGSLIFCPKIPFSELFKKNILPSSRDSYFFKFAKICAVFCDKLSKI